MNCKPGDLAVIVRSTKFPQYLGRIVTVTKLAEATPPHWEVEPPIFVPGYVRCAIVADSGLRPIRDPGDDSRDETLDWLPVPSKEREHA